MSVHSTEAFLRTIALLGGMRRELGLQVLILGGFAAGRLLTR
jgi:hypothetical protein